MGRRPCTADYPLSRLRRQLPFQGGLYDALLPPLKGEVPAKWAVGFNNADFGRFNLWRPAVVNRIGGSVPTSVGVWGSAKR